MTEDLEYQANDLGHQLGYSADLTPEPEPCGPSVFAKILHI